jgi:hypothetical protein
MNQAKKSRKTKEALVLVLFLKKEVISRKQRKNGRKKEIEEGRQDERKKIGRKKERRMERKKGRKR